MYSHIREDTVQEALICIKRSARIGEKNEVADSWN